MDTAQIERIRAAIELAIFDHCQTEGKPGDFLVVVGDPDVEMEISICSQGKGDIATLVCEDEANGLYTEHELRFRIRVETVK